MVRLNPRKPWKKLPLCATNHLHFSPPRSGNLLVTKEPTRTLSKPLVEGGFCEDFENLSIHGEENKENNDSAVGGLLGTPVRSPKEHKDGKLHQS